MLLGGTTLTNNVLCLLTVPNPSRNSQGRWLCTCWLSCKTGCVLLYKRQLLYKLSTSTWKVKIYKKGRQRSWSYSPTMPRQEIVQTHTYTPQSFTPISMQICVSFCTHIIPCFSNALNPIQSDCLAAVHYLWLRVAALTYLSSSSLEGTDIDENFHLQWSHPWMTKALQGWVQGF